MITRPALKYYGGKFRIADWIIKHLPAHDVYLEPCFGAGSILLNKSRSKVEIVNDLDSNIVNYFKMLRDKPNELINAINFTPWARDEAYLNPNESGITGIEKARRFWAKCHMRIGLSDSSGWRVSTSKKTQASMVLCDLSHLHAIADRLRGVQIENIDALEFIPRYARSDCVIYFDPPYTAATRARKNEYAFEVSEQFHVNAAALLNEVPGYKIVSGYRSTLYNELYAGWHRVDQKSQVNGSGCRMESLWLSPNIGGYQQRLF